MTNAPSATIELGPLIQFVAPIAATIASGVISWGIATGIGLIRKMSGVTISDAEHERVRRFANDQAAKAIALSESNLAHQSITINSPQVVTGVQLAQRVIPELLKSTGLTPEAIAGMIAAEIGRLQSSGSTSAITTAVVPAPVPAPAPAIN